MLDYACISDLARIFYQINLTRSALWASCRYIHIVSLSIQSPHPTFLVPNPPHFLPRSPPPRLLART